MNTEDVTWKEKQKILKAINSSEELLKEAISKSSKKENRILEKIANIFFSPLSQRLPLFFPKWTNRLQQAIFLSGMNILSTSYFSLLFFTAIINIFIGTSLGIVLFYTISLWYGFILGITLGIITGAIFLVYPFYSKARRKKELEEEAPFIINHCSALSNSGVKTQTIFHILSIIPYYQTFSIDCRRMRNYQQNLNLSVSESIKKTAELNPSPKIKAFLLEWAQAIEEKKEINHFLREKAKSSIERYRKQKNFFKSYKNTWVGIHRFLKVFSLRTGHLIAIPVMIGAIVLLFQTVNINESYFFIILTSIFIIGWLPVLVETVYTIRKYKKQEISFVSFIKDLEEKRNILKLEGEYKALHTEVKKLKNQYKMGIPLEKALETFARDTKNSLIKATISMSIEATKEGADIYRTIYELGSSKILREILKTN